MARSGKNRINPALKMRGIELPYSAHHRTVTAKLASRRNILRDETRSRVTELFKPLIGQSLGVDWVQYAVGPRFSRQPDIAGYPDYDVIRDFVIIRDSRGSSKMPNLRMFAKEFYESDGIILDDTADKVNVAEASDGGEDDEEVSYYLIEDFTLNPQGIAYFALSGVWEDFGTQSLRYAPSFYTEHPDGTPHENYLVVPHYRNSTRRYSMQTHIRYRQDIHPFGFRLNLLDQIDAFAPAQAMLEQAERAPQPYLWGTQATL
ncbi:MAG TPA: hypothetical protein VLG47_00270 [Candidatus Saccharimonadales bacterium]|nr:hypothetical protein [Candidatus Saccharimonadales bacterium]